MPTSSALRFGLLNLWCFGGLSRRARQQEVIAHADLDVLCLLEVDPADIERFALTCDFAWWRCSVGANVPGRHLAVAVVGSSRVTPRRQVQLSVNDFLQDHDGLTTYPELARWYHERHIAVDLGTAEEAEIRVGAFHATPGTSRGPGRMGVSGRKPWYHTRIAEWVATWPAPYLFGIDANTPKRDALAWSETEFFWPSGRAGHPGEEFLVGPPGTVAHRARDLWREWLMSPAGASDLAGVPSDGPLAQSHRLPGGRWCRYDNVGNGGSRGSRHEIRLRPLMLGPRPGHGNGPRRFGRWWPCVARGLPLAGAHAADSSSSIPARREPAESSAPVSAGASPTQRATRLASPGPLTTARVVGRAPERGFMGTGR